VRLPAVALVAALVLSQAGAAAGQEPAPVVIPPVPPPVAAPAAPVDPLVTVPAAPPVQDPALALPADVTPDELPLVAIDPGHGGGDSGAIGLIPAGTATGLPPRVDKAGRTALFEKDVTLDVGYRLKEALERRGFRTMLTRTQDLAGGDRPRATTVADLKARTDLANAAGAGLFLSVHANSWTAASAGTETYRFRSTGVAGRTLALVVHQEVVRALGLPDRGVKTAGFYVLRHSAMPAVLVEGAFLSNPAEALMLAQPDVRQRLAEGIANGVVRYVVIDPPLPPPALAPPPIRYWVTAGVFRRRADALSRAGAARRAGHDAAVRRRTAPKLRRTMFYVVTGQFADLANAKEEREALRAARLPGMVTGSSVGGRR
jgi:N-acetylmuramoyl-L-alanine amidase